MKYVFKFVAMLDAVDLPRLNIESMDIDELLDHENQVIETISGVKIFIASASHMSANETLNSGRLLTKLKEHLARVSNLIIFHKLAIISQAGTIAIDKSHPAAGIQKISH